MADENIFILKIWTMVFCQNAPVSLRCTGFVSNFMQNQQPWLSTCSKKQFSFVICLIHAWERTSRSGQCTNTSAMRFPVKNLHFHTYQAADQCQLEPCWSWANGYSGKEGRCPDRIKGNGYFPLLPRAVTPLEHLRAWWGDCRSINSGWNAKCSEVTLFSVIRCARAQRRKRDVWSQWGRDPRTQRQNR